MKTDQELKQLAIDIYDNKVFTDRHIREGESAHRIAVIFMPIALGAFKTKEEIDDLGLIYEYYDKASPRAINGYPSFFSFNTLTKAECEIMSTHYDAYSELKNKFLENSPITK